jgi:phosphatidylinositol 4-phosphatase
VTILLCHISQMPFVFYIACFMICAGLTLPRSSGKCHSLIATHYFTFPSDLPLFFYFIVWTCVLVVALIFIIINGVDYVNWPRLIPLTDIIEYNGPGTKTSRNGRGFPSLHNDKQKRPVPKSTDSHRHKDELDHGAKERLD